MKTTKFLPILFPILLASLSACSEENKKLNINILTKLKEATYVEKYSDLSSMLSDKDNEDFLLATYSTAYSTGCSCWSEFKNIINKYVNETSIPIYYFDTDNLYGHEEKFGISELTTSDPQFYAFKDTKIVKKFNEFNNFFKSYVHFAPQVNNLLTMPENNNLFYVNEDYLNKNIKITEKAIVLFERDGCGDCRYVLPKVLYPFSSENSFKTEIWIFNMQSFNGTEKYDSIKTTFGLNEQGNSIFGYSTGFVPTIQHYTNGIIDDAAVFFNDSLSTVDNKTTVTRTYYTQSRLENLTFLKNSSVEVKVLENLEISKNDVVGTSSWSNEAASKYHTPIFNQFLNYYCL